MIGRLLGQRVGVSLALLLLVGAVAAQVIGERERGRTGPPLSSRDADAGGALALALWLEDLGYRVTRLDEGPSASLRSVDILFVLRPRRPFDAAEARAVASWVREGGLLVYALSWERFSGPLAPTPDPLAEEMALAARLMPPLEYAEPTFPFFSTPPADRFRVNSTASLELRDDAWVPLIGHQDRVVAATRLLGRGRVLATTAEALLSNSGLPDDDNAALVLNLLAHASGGRAVAFEEAHHSAVRAPNLTAVARASAWGWALGYAGLITLGFALWGGRRFGPAVIAPRLPARSTGDYVVALAGLLQRARATRWAQARSATIVRRRLAQLLGVRADLPGPDLAQRFADRRPVDPAALAGHLAALEGRPLRERDLLRRMREIERLLAADRAPTRPPSETEER